MDRLDIHELSDAERTAFAPVARVLHPAEGCARIGANILVHEAHSCFELFGGDPTAAVEIRSDHSRPEAELAVVRDLDRIRFALGGNDRGDRPKDFFIVRRLART